MYTCVTECFKRVARNGSNLSNTEKQTKTDNGRNDSLAQEVEGQVGAGCVCACEGVDVTRGVK
jgi:hypothetical protein